MALTTKPTIAPHQIDKDSPAFASMAITPSDTDYLADANDKALVTRAIMSSAGGTITVELAGNAAGTYLAFTMAANVIYPLAVVRVRSTGTAATGIYGLF